MNADLKNVFLGMLCAARCAKASTFWSCGVIFFPMFILFALCCCAGKVLLLKHTTL